MKRGWKTGMVMVAAIAMSVSGIGSSGSGEPSTAKADHVSNITAGEAVVQKEITTKRNRFMKQYVLSDGSFFANSFSMPILYKKNGKWKEIDTTFVKTKDGKKYRTKSTSLSIQVAKKAMHSILQRTKSSIRKMEVKKQPMLRVPIILSLMQIYLPKQLKRESKMIPTGL